MHAGMRRVPAERARHAKRLGHVNQAGPGVALPVVINNTTTASTQLSTSSQTVPSATSATHPLSSALSSSSSSSTVSSSSASSSATTSSAAAFSTGSQTLAAPSSTNTLSATFSVPTSSSTPSANATPSTSSSLSGGAIAGIIAGAAVVGALLVVFFVRKTYLRRRERMRISWSGSPGMGADKLDEPKPPFQDISERRAPSPQRIGPLVGPQSQSVYASPVSPLAHHPPSTPAYVVPTPPSATYNNPTPVAAYPAHQVPSAYGPNPVPLVRSQNTPAEAMVKCTFVPTLPDELSITTGERIFILEQYDDGWNLCANARGERGMVPRDCLEHAPIDQPDMGWKDVGRTSSLNADGMRY